MVALLDARELADGMSGADDATLAARLARGAGSLLLQLRSTGAGSGRALGAAGDRQSDDLILGVLSTLRAADSVLSEESADNHTRLAARRVWIVDPLDGTREYAEGRHDWAVHVALWEDGRLAAGAVALPAVGMVLDAARPVTLPPPGQGRPIRVAVSRSRPPTFVTALVAALGAEPVPLGSAGYKCCAVLRGEVDAYVHAGGQYEWDSAAPVCVAASAGLHTSRVDGAPLVYNRRDPWLPDLLVCRPELADTLLALIGEHAKDPR